MHITEWFVGVIGGHSDQCVGIRSVQDGRNVLMDEFLLYPTDLGKHLGMKLVSFELRVELQVCSL